MSVENIHVDERLLDRFFPDAFKVNKSNLQVTNEGFYSVTGKFASAKLVEYISKIMKRDDIVITDATANNGSDTISFALKFKKVNAIELNLANFNVLKNNVKVYSLSNVNLIHGDSIEQIPNLEQDVLYFDPPWGGREYKKNEFMKLYLGEYEISDIYNKFHHLCKFMVFKLPTNYDLSYFTQNTSIKKFMLKSYSFKDKIKFYFLFCDV